MLRSNYISDRLIKQKRSVRVALPQAHTALFREFLQMSSLIHLRLIVFGFSARFVFFLFWPRVMHGMVSLRCAFLLILVLPYFSN